MKPQSKSAKTAKQAQAAPSSEPSAALAAQLRGDWLEAERLYLLELAEAQESGASALLPLANLGQVLRQTGRSTEALALYRRAAAMPDAPAAVWFNLGNGLFDQSDWRQAAEAFTQALALDPQLESAALALARCRVNLGELGIAREAFAAILRTHPQNFSAWLEAGHVCRKTGPSQQMLACYRQAVALEPQRWVGHASLARALAEQGQADAAALHYHLALACDDAGKGLVVHRLIGKGRLESGDFAGAVAAFRHALTAVPDDYDSMVDLADALFQIAGVAVAVSVLQRVTDQAGTGTLTRMAELLFRHNQYDEAQAVLRKLVLAHPNDWTVHFNLAKLLADSWSMDEGLRALERAEALSPEPVPGAASLRAAVAGKLGDVDECLQLYLEMGKADGAESPYLSSAAMSSLYSDTLSALAITEFHRDLFEPLGQGARNQFANPLEAERKLRIGYVTADLHHQHPVNLFMQPVLARHDARAVEVTVYFVGVAGDEQTRLAKERVARWRDAGAMTDQRLAQQIEADGIDILIDLLGHTSYNRRALFARRAAPVQACFMGYPGSTGLPNMDWLIADPVVAPASHAHLYTEQVMRLPHCVFCYAPEQDYPFPDYNSKFSKRRLTFGSFNNISKLTPWTIELWARVMQAVPDARLLLKAPSFRDLKASQRFAELFAKAGVSVDRLEFRGPVGLADMMAEYADVDIALDTYPYNGGTTTYQALWMGVPVVSLVGEAFCQRMGASILTAIGRSEWVASSADEFVRVASQLAADREGLLKEKTSLRARMQAAPALDIGAYTRDLEAAYRKMWHQFLAHQDAQHKARNEEMA